MPDVSWPVILLALRITVVVLLYGFLLVAVRALRAEIHERTMPSFVPAAEPQYVPALAEPVDEFDEPTTVIPTAGIEMAPARPRSRWAVLAPLSVGIPLLLVGAMVIVLRLSPPVTAQPTPSTSKAEAEAIPSAIPGRVAVSLSAAEDSNVRVTIDGTVQYEGMMRPGERRNWDGKSVVAIWTDKGKSLDIAVDGRDLGPYSPAMGHPDWNRIEYSFWPGWSQSAAPR